MRTRRGRSVRWLLLSVIAATLVVPLLAFLGLRLFQVQLIRQTETKLIAEAVVIAEAWRDHLLEGLPPETAAAPSILPPGTEDRRYRPVEPLLGDDDPLLPALAEPTRFAEDQTAAAWRAGARLQPLLERAQTFNLSSARVVDAEGCVVATTGVWLAACLDHVPEIRTALAGRYAAATRERVSNEPKPSFTSISRRGDVRVFSALPVFSDGGVIGAVWMSRTAMDPLKAAWLNRRPLLTTLGASVLLTALVSWLLSRRITRPLRGITRAAAAVARGEPPADITPEGTLPAEIHDLASALATMTRQLSDRADYIAEFAANASHELKSPITSIRGATELLREEGDEMPPGQQETFLANIDADAARMQRLVGRLLELARIQSAPESAEEVELVPFLQSLVDGYSGRVVLDIEEGAPATIRINPEHLESALRNLLDNALRHGGQKPVELSLSRRESRLALGVRDHGSGISEANQEKIFQRFFTTERDRGGTGLGLAIVQAVAQTRGGEVTLDCGPGGTVFTLVV